MTKIKFSNIVTNKKINKFINLSRKSGILNNKLNVEF